MPVDNENVGSLAQWIQAGGLGLFAASVFVLLRDMKRSQEAFMLSVGTSLAKLLERRETLELIRNAEKSGPVKRIVTQAEED